MAFFLKGGFPMFEFLHENVGYIERTSSGFQIGMSWGVLFGIPICLAGLWVFNTGSRIWHNIKSHDAKKDAAVA